ncbi:hypothetical protein F5884DRAFT_844405 [Xylogone sp. PMI_703]|nr:hypothetical protein F5884DRAFT_844405 [Xylogone sp. PMI_703]
MSAFIGGGIAFLWLFRAAWYDYRMYLSYGPGGLPYNLYGWFVSTIILRPMGTDVFDIRMYDKKPDKRTWLHDNWPSKARVGPRPHLGPHPLPQRQLNQLSSDTVHQKLADSFAAVVSANPSLVQFKPSLHEGHTESIFLADHIKATPIAEEMLREISHIHATGDHSVHVVLAPQDCKKVIRSGWGQRHPLDGVRAVKYIFGWTIPKEYILLYAPRNDEEIQTIMEVVKASIGFMTGSREVK